LGVAIHLMDNMTQQNAELVEVMSAAAGSLKSQADALVNTVAVFKLNARHPHAHPEMLAISNQASSRS